MTTNDSTQHDAIDQDATTKARVGRRDLLRRAGTVAAVAGGAAVAGAAMSGTAQATTGNPVVMGAANDAGTTSTALASSASTEATLVVQNSGTRGPIRLAENASATFSDTTLEAGELFQVGGDLFYVPVGAADGGPIPAAVFNELTALQLVPIVPLRVLDTRTAGGRARIVSWTHDSSQRLQAGHWLTLDLADLGDFFDAIVGNITVTGSSALGYVSMGPAALAGAPAVSTINYDKGQTIANGMTCAVNTNDGTVAIYARTSTHVILDLTAFNTPGPSWINAPKPQTAFARSSAVRAGFQKARARAKH